ncbi:MAG: DnaJ C-terminal domain-containing protein [Natronospirillum sp.]
MEFKDYYKILGVEPDADAKDIKAAYRKLARKYHPDVSEEPNAEDQFKTVSEAYEALRDPEKRREYDDIRRYGQAGQPFQPPPGWHSRHRGSSADNAGFSDFFESIFGNGFAREDLHSQGSPFGARRQAPAKGQDVDAELPLLLEETLGTDSKRISYHVPAFEASGRQITQKKKTLDVKIPAGVLDGERIRLKGQGAASPTRGGTPGDLYITVRFAPHPLFDVEGHDLKVVVPLAPWEAALGTKVDVPTLTGKIKLTVPPNSQSGQRLRIKGKGMRTRTGYGELFAEFKIVMPPHMTDSEQSLWQQLAHESPFDPRAKWVHVQANRSQKV